MATDILVLNALITANLRAPTSGARDQAGGYTFTFDPPLSVAEQAILADLQLMAGFGIASNITLAEFQAIKPSLVIGQQIIAAPGGTVLTAAQNLASHQATWRVLRALLRS